MKNLASLFFASLFAILTIGCGGSDEDEPKKDWGQRFAEGLIETAIEQSAKQDGKNVDVDIDFDAEGESGGLTITGEDGEKVTLSAKDGELKMTGTEGEDFSITGKDGKIVMKDKDGNEETILSNVDKIPSDFPKDVYLVKGDFKTGGIVNTGDAKVLTVVINAKSDFDDVIEKIKKEMKSDGWKSTMDMNMNGESLQSYSKEDRGVLITTKTNNDIVEVGYMITKKKK